LYLDGEGVCKKLFKICGVSQNMVLITAPEKLKDCFPKVYISQDYPEEWLQALLNSYREEMQALVELFLRDKLCSECKKKIGLI